MNNPNVPESINQWHIVCDPSGFTEREDWLRAAEQVENILREHVYSNGPTINVGFYNGAYWSAVAMRGCEHVLEQIESTSPEEVAEAVYIWLTRYANGA